MAIHKGQAVQEDHANKLLNSHKVFLKSSALTSPTSLVVEILILLLVVTRKSFVSSKFLTAVPRTTPSSSVNPVSVRLLLLKAYLKKSLTVACHKNSKANKSFVSMWSAWFKGLVSVANLKNACKNSWKKFVNVRMLSYLLMKSMKS